MHGTMNLKIILGVYGYRCLLQLSSGISATGPRVSGADQIAEMSPV